MDGLLLDSERLVVDAFQQTVRDFDLPDLTHAIHEMIGLRSDMGDKILRAALPGHMDHGQFDTRWHEHINAVFAKGIPLRPGVLSLLEQIKTLGLPCAVATSTKTTNAKHHLSNAGISDYFQTVTGGDQVDAPKPAPDIYHRAAQSIGLNTKDCIAFEDSDPGTKAAIAAGATTVQVPDIKPPAPEMHNHGHVIAPSLLDGARIVGLLAT